MKPPNVWRFSGGGGTAPDLRLGHRVTKPARSPPSACNRGLGLCLTALQRLLKEHHLKPFLVPTSDATISMMERKLLCCFLYYSSHNRHRNFDEDCPCVPCMGIRPASTHWLWWLFIISIF